MSQAQKYIIAVEITTTAPLQIAAIEAGTFNPENGRITRFKTTPGVQCTLTTTMPLANMARMSEEDPSRVFVPEVPVIPASSICGQLRRKASDLIFDSLAQRDYTISTSAYNTMTSGTATTDLNASECTPEVRYLARKDAFLACFGGTSFAIDAQSVIATGWPLLECTQDFLMAPAMSPAMPQKNLKDLTSAIAIIRKNDVAEMKGRHLQDVIQQEELIAYLESQAVERSETQGKKANDGEAGKKTNLRTFNAIEAINTGTTFAIQIAVTAHTPQQMGLMLLAVQEMLRHGQIGGKAARGFGQFVATTSRLYKVNPQTRALNAHGQIFSGKESQYQFVDDDLINELVQAGEDYVLNFEPELIEAFADADPKALKAIYKSTKPV